jgi:hypothetical protein
MAEETTGRSARVTSEVAKLVQVLSVVAGVVLSIWSFNATRQKEAAALEAEAAQRKAEAAAPFLKLRQGLYAEAVKAAAVLATPQVHTADELATAKKRFAELYVAELSMVEAQSVEGQMVAMAKQVYPELLNFTNAQRAAYDLAHALRDSFVESWNVGR